MSSFMKLAVSLEQLRTASRAMRGRVLRAGWSVPKGGGLRVSSRAATDRILHGAQQALKRSAKTNNFDGMMQSFDTIQRNHALPVSWPRRPSSYWSSATTPETEPFIRSAKRLSGNALIYGDSSKKVLDPKVYRRLSPEGREAFNRSVWLHEGAELAPHPGSVEFGSHMSVKPPLQDLNVAATLHGPGSDAAKAIRKERKGDVESLKKAVPGLSDLRFGKERLSRHAIRRIQQAYERSTKK